MCNFFEKIVEELSNGENLNYIDKFLILLSLRMVCVNKMLVLESSSQIKSSISLEDIIKKIIENFTPNLRTLQCTKDIEIIIGYPNTIKSKDNITNGNSYELGVFSAIIEGNNMSCFGKKQPTGEKNTKKCTQGCHKNTKYLQRSKARETNDEC